MKTRWFNYRPLCVIFLFLLLGSIFSFYVVGYTFLSILILLMTVAFILLVAINKRKLIYILVPIISFILGCSVYCIAKAGFKKEIAKPTVCSGRIFEISKEYNKNLIVYLENCKFDDKNVDTNLKLNIYDSKGLFEGMEVGSYIIFTPTQYKKIDLCYYDIPNSNYYTNKLKYQVNTNYNDITKLKVDKTLDEQIREYTKSCVSKGLTNQNTEIAYSSLFGDKTYLNEQIYASYKLSGVAHLLAVSGLHVGIIVGIISWICKKCKAKPIVKFIVSACFLIFYMYLCDFTPSVVRASIMALTLLFAPICFREPDALSAISLAGIIYFLFNPFCVFDVGFLLSFSCVIGIIMLSKSIKLTLSNRQSKNVLIESFSISTATSVSIMIIMAYFFRTLNIISLIANLILIPIFTVVFSFIFVVSLLSLILPFLGHILVIANPVLDFINLITSYLGSLPIANFTTISINYFSIVIYFAFIMLIGRICMAKRKEKVFLIIPTVALLLVSFI